MEVLPTMTDLCSVYVSWATSLTRGGAGSSSSVSSSSSSSTTIFICFFCCVDGFDTRLFVPVTRFPEFELRGGLSLTGALRPCLRMVKRAIFGRIMVETKFGDVKDGWFVQKA